MEYQVESLGPVVTLVDDVIGFSVPQGTIAEELLRPDPNAAWSRYDEDLFQTLGGRPLVPRASSTGGERLTTTRAETTFDDLMEEYVDQCDSELPAVTNDFGIDFNWSYYRLDEIPPSLYTSAEVAALHEKQIDKRTLVPPPPLYYDPLLYSSKDSAEVEDSGASGATPAYDDLDGASPEEQALYHELDWFTDAAFEHVKPLEGPGFDKEALIPTQALLTLRDELIAAWLSRAEAVLHQMNLQKRLLLLRTLALRAQRAQDAERAYEDWCERKDVLSAEEKSRVRAAARRISNVFYNCVNPNYAHTKHTDLTRSHSAHAVLSSGTGCTATRPAETFEEWLGGALERLRLARRRRLVERRIRTADEDTARARRGIEVETQILTWREGMDQNRIARRQESALQDRLARLGHEGDSQPQHARSSSPAHQRSRGQPNQRQAAAAIRADEDRTRARIQNERKLRSLVDMTGVATTGELTTDVRRIVSEMKPSDRKYVRWLWKSRQISGARREGLKLLLEEAEDVEAIRRGDKTLRDLNANDHPTTRMEATAKRLSLRNNVPQTQRKVWR